MKKIRSKLSFCLLFFLYSCNNDQSYIIKNENGIVSKIRSILIKEFSNKLEYDYLVEQEREAVNYLWDDYKNGEPVNLISLVDLNSFEEVEKAIEEMENNRVYRPLKKN